LRALLSTPLGSCAQTSSDFSDPVLLRFSTLCDLRQDPKEAGRADRVKRAYRPSESALGRAAVLRW
jgi:hypothetical protein